MKKRLYYHPNAKRYLVIFLVGEVVMEDSEDIPTRRYLRCNYKKPSKRGYKFVGELKLREDEL